MSEHVNDNWLYCFNFETELKSQVALRFDVRQIKRWLKELLMKFEDVQSLAGYIGISQAHGLLL